uniref:Uncharacterized protein n=1 Tax=Rhizophora mucronata TaxID=61149 RepID=A0A2P2NW25_RHIMU
MIICNWMMLLLMELDSLIILLLITLWFQILSQLQAKPIIVTISICFVLLLLYKVETIL